MCMMCLLNFSYMYKIYLDQIQPQLILPNLLLTEFLLSNETPPTFTTVLLLCEIP